MKSITVTLFAALSVILLAPGACGKVDLPQVPDGLDQVDNSDNTGSGDSDRATIAGFVTDENGNPVKGAVISDGISVVRTDVKGEYHILSDKSTGFVFISIPGEYTVVTKETGPEFYHYLLSEPEKLEIHNFHIHSCDNSKSSIIIHADQHLANRTEDISQFDRTVLPDLLSTIDSRKAMGRTLYSISLGDMSWEQFWRANNFDFPDALRKFRSLGIPLFHTIGNHDNDPYISDDWNSSAIFRNSVGPNYYSFNIGKTHFVVLDNVIYNNPGATLSQMGERTYDRAVSKRQLEWLSADLAMIEDKSNPLIICGHVPFYSDPSLKDGVETIKRNLLNMEDLEYLLSDFSNVTLLSGHYHRNYTVNSPYRVGIREYNVASLSGTLWWTGKSGYADNHICTDGSPGGYGILDIDDSVLKYTYKGIGHQENYQFRIYDLNTLRIDETSVSDSRYRDKVKEYADRYYTPSAANEVLINVFNWGPGWNIEVLEDDTALPVKRIRAKDPLHILSYECQRLSHGAIPTATSTLITQNTSHIFSLRASKASSLLKIKVTDPYGREYVSEVARPVKGGIWMK